MYGLYFIISCSPSKKFTNENKTVTVKPETGLIPVTYSEVRVLLDEKSISDIITLQNDVYLYSDDKKIDKVLNGSSIQCYNENYNLRIVINDKEFSGSSFKLIPVEDNFVMIDGIKYKGMIMIYPAGSSVGLVNHLSLEDYVKGVLTKEMPVGNGEQNLEALKALAVCIRTYAVNRIKNGNTLFDLFKDTRDQVYGGVNAEHPVSNKAVEQTEGLFLLYDNQPAIIYYHSTCGGTTESSENVLTNFDVPYLHSIKDGNPPYCSISNRYSWEEKYSDDILIKRLINANLLDDGDYKIVEININSRFESGRVNELELVLDNNNGNKSSVKIYGNSIRDIIKTSSGSMGLWSILFEVEKDENSVIIRGHGFGHGVGLCQWGAIALSQRGKSFEEILYHYYPGTIIGKIND